MPSPIQQQLKLTATTADKLSKLGIHNVWDALLHLPLRYEDETHLTPIRDTQVGQTCQIEGIIRHQEIQFRPRRQLIAQLQDNEGNIIYLRYLNFYPSQQQQLAQGKHIRALGEIRQGYYGKEMVHPKVSQAEGKALASSLTPIYPTIKGLSQPTLRRIIQAALKSEPLTDTLPPAIRERYRLSPIDDTIRLLHQPSPEHSQAALQSPEHPAWQRLKFDELLAQQISMQLARQKRQHASAQALHHTGEYIQALIKALPFPLTSAQQRVIQEIQTDLAQSHPMHRLLQGDVGSGKTIVAAISALAAIEAGAQVALMAPTEILAEQHHQKFSQWLSSLGIPCALLTGSQKKSQKEQTKHALQTGSLPIVIGTHALLQDTLQFHQLGLIIVDEQHRFGVGQRLTLKNKGQHIHQLMMTATPIPRTLAQSHLADLDISTIDELPPGRSPIRTRLINSRRRHEIEGFVLHTCQSGQQVYWVCPLIEESETLQLQTAQDTQATLQQSLPELNIGLLHGRMKSAEKANVMAQFASGAIHVLVATTVIEVGVDVPNASLMVIEHAERMGLAQLHQLRGRVGRGSAQSSCVLLFSEPLSDAAKARLKAIYQSQDGFAIAEADYQIRGPGELLGTRQSGTPMLRFAHLEDDQHLIEQSQILAQQLLLEHPAIAQTHLNRWLSQREDYLGA